MYTCCMFANCTDATDALSHATDALCIAQYTAWHGLDHVVHSTLARHASVQETINGQHTYTARKLSLGKCVANWHD